MLTAAVQVTTGLLERERPSEVSLWNRRCVALRCVFQRFSRFSGGRSSSSSSKLYLSVNRSSILHTNW